MVSPAAGLKRYGFLISQPPQSCAVSTMSGFRDIWSLKTTVFRSWCSIRVCSILRAVHSVRNRYDSDESVQASGERKMREVQSNTNFDAATRGTETSIRLGTAAIVGATNVSVYCLRRDWIHFVSIGFWPWDAPADWSRDTAAWAAKRHSSNIRRSRRECRVVVLDRARDNRLWTPPCWVAI